MLMYVGVVDLLRNLPLYGGGFVSPLIRDQDIRRDVLTGQSTGYGPIKGMKICLGYDLRRKLRVNYAGK